MFVSYYLTETSKKYFQARITINCARCPGRDKQLLFASVAGGHTDRERQTDSTLLDASTSDRVIFRLSYGSQRVHLHFIFTTSDRMGGDTSRTEPTSLRNFQRTRTFAELSNKKGG